MKVKKILSAAWIPCWMNIWEWNRTELVTVWKWIAIAMDPRIYSPFPCILGPNTIKLPITKERERVIFIHSKINYCQEHTYSKISKKLLEVLTD